MKKLKRKRHEYIVSKLDNVLIILEEIEKHPYMRFGELAKISQIRGGLFSATIADAKNLCFILNGNGLHLSSIGKEYLMTKSPEILKSASLQLPFFKAIFENLGPNASYSIIRDWVKNNKEHKFSDQFIGSVATRYYECMTGYTPQRPVMQKQTIISSNSEIITTPPPLKNMLINLGLSKSDIVKIINSVKSKGKRDKLMEELL